MRGDASQSSGRASLREVVGVGPLGALALALLFWAARTVERSLSLRPLGGPSPFHDLIAAVLLAVAAIVFWRCVRDMPLPEHGRTLITTGIYRHLRHPRYAAAVLCVYPAIALLLHSAPCLTSTALALPLVWAITRLEEGRLVRTFGDEYREYMRTTPGFIPKVWHRRR